MGIPADMEGAQGKSVAPEIIQKVMKTAADYDMIIKG
jgi:hypothetical protein